METSFRAARNTRRLLAKYIDNLIPQQLNKIPEGFNNNIIWNIAHIVVTQQRIVYGLSGQLLHVSPEMERAYRNGTKPEYDVTPEEIEEIKTLLFTLRKKQKKIIKTVCLSSTGNI